MSNICACGLDSPLVVSLALTTVVHHQVLKLSSDARTRTSVGQIVNLMAVDATRIGEGFSFLLQPYTLVLQLCTASVMLWILFGPASLAALAFYVVIIVLNVFGFANILTKLQVGFTTLNILIIFVMF